MREKDYDYQVSRLYKAKKGVNKAEVKLRGS
jgi:hypothetical protein